MLIPLANGQLSVTVLKQGELVLGELTQGHATVGEIRQGLKAGGYEFGHQVEYIQKLSSGYRGQLPIAISKIRVELVKFHVDFVKDLDIDEKDPYDILAELHSSEISGMVMEGDRLLTIHSTSKRIMRRSDGSEVLLSDAGQSEVKHFLGKNVSTNEAGNAIFASIDGVAQITTRGRVSVYPFEAVNSLGKVHGDIETEHALLVQGDINSGAQVSTHATLIVRGIIRGANIRCGGDLDSLNGLENLIKGEEGIVRVQQNLRTSNIKNFNVWVGAKLFASRIIDQSQVEVLDTLACPRIADSRIHVGHQLITYNIVRDSVIKFGPGAVEDPFITKFKQTHLARSRKHHDSHLSLEYQQAHLEQLRQKAILIIQRLKTEGQSTVTVGNVLKRYLVNMQENFKIYKNEYEDLQKIEAIVRQERAEIAYHDSFINSFVHPRIIVAGKMEAGTRLIGPEDSMVLDRAYSSVEVSLDPETRRLRFTDLKPRKVVLQDA